MRRAAADLQSNAELKTDVVVVGAGPIGIVTALELTRAGHRVTLVESGYVDVSEAAQRLTDSPGGDDPFHVAKELAVRRQVGGTTVLWGGRCVPFDPVDFEVRPVQPDPLWPVQYKEMAQYLKRACRWSVCGDAVFNARHQPGLADRDMVPFLPDGEIRSTDLERWSLPTRFGKVYREALESDPRLDLITDLTCTEIVCSADGSAVDHLELRSLEKAQATIRAKYYVLANGGLEATRLLMHSDAVHKGGIGNHSNHLGRWYMAHVEGRVARMHLTTPADQTIHDHEKDPDGVYVRRRFTFAPEFQRDQRLSNAAIWIVNPEMGDATHGSGILSGVYLTLISPLGKYMLAEAIRRAGTKTSRPGTLRQHLANIVRDLVPAAGFAVSFVYARFLRRGRKAPGFFVRSASNVYPLHYHGEHLPHYDSHVELSPQRDALGVRRLRTRLQFSDEDISSVGRAMKYLDAYLRKHCVGYLEYLDDDVDASVRKYLIGTAGYHQSGTTRMSARPEDGVVTPDLAVHGVPNLYVSSTSVLPTSGQANPTLTGIAFAIRLAEHLDSQLMRG
jgi:choline dehydrogenase-like flavoprotein